MPPKAKGGIAEALAEQLFDVLDTDKVRHDSCTLYAHSFA
jgi:hypothetical protein